MAKGICSVEECGGLSHAFGMCAMHYRRWKRHGDTTALKRYNVGTAEQRFWAKVEKSDGCWNWIAGTVTGYGLHSIGRKRVLAHRFSYELLVGPIPDGLQLDHRCHNRRCVNPDHLRPATNGQNVENHQGARADSQSGVRGVRRHRQSQLWMATVQHDGVIHTRYFRNKADAAAAVIEMRNELHSFNDQDRSNSTPLVRAQ